MRLSLMSVIYGVEGLSPIRMGLIFISYINPALRPSAFTLGFILSARLRGLNIRTLNRNFQTTSSIRNPHSAIGTLAPSTAIESLSTAVEGLSIAIERYSVTIERLSIAVEGLSITIETSSIAVERLSITAEASSTAKEKVSIAVEALSFRVEISSIAILGLKIAISVARITPPNAKSLLVRAYFAFFLNKIACSCRCDKRCVPSLEELHA